MYSLMSNVLNKRFHNAFHMQKLFPYVSAFSHTCVVTIMTSDLKLHADDGYLKWFAGWDHIWLFWVGLCITIHLNLNDMDLESQIVIFLFYSAGWTNSNKGGIFKGFWQKQIPRLLYTAFLWSHILSQYWLLPLYWLDYFKGMAGSIHQF